MINISCYDTTSYHIELKNYLQNNLIYVLLWGSVAPEVVFWPIGIDASIIDNIKIHLNFIRIERKVKIVMLEHKKFLFTQATKHVFYTDTLCVNIEYPNIHARYFSGLFYT
jgi:hypothetical protein